MTPRVIDNQRIAKNTLLLYARTLVVMIITLYTSRVVLKVLGVTDYGVYQTVGGMVAMLSVVSGSLSTAISRFITFEIGRGDKIYLKKIFATSVIVQILLSVLIVPIAETVGLWFLNTKMQIPPDRLSAAYWVLQWTLVTFCINLFNVPYNAVIIAHERMNIFAYVSVVEAICKLAVCFLVVKSQMDRLASYAFLLAVVSLGVRLFYGYYCKRHFEECSAKITFDISTFKQIFGFAGWSFMSSTVALFNNQGVNMLMNLFFGVTANAARGIANQVESAVLNFVNNFTMAVNPQITKSYAVGDMVGMHKLVCRSAKFSFFAMLLIALPIICEANTILNIWLVEVPQHTVIFVQLSLVLGMLDCIGNSGYTACMATGRLRKYAILISSVGIMEFPLTWIFFKYGAPVVSTYYLFIAVKSAVLITRMYLLKEMVDLKVSQYITEVFIPILSTTIVAIIPSVLIVCFVDSTIYRLLLSVIVGMLSVSVSVLFIGCSKYERVLVLDKVSCVINKLVQSKSL